MDKTFSLFVFYTFWWIYLSMSANVSPPVSHSVSIQFQMNKRFLTGESRDVSLEAQTQCILVIICSPTTAVRQQLIQASLPLFSLLWYCLCCNHEKRCHYWNVGGFLIKKSFKKTRFRNVLQVGQEKWFDVLLSQETLHYQWMPYFWKCDILFFPTSPLIINVSRGRALFFLGKAILRMTICVEISLASLCYLLVVLVLWHPLTSLTWC